MKNLIQFLLFSIWLLTLITSCNKAKPVMDAAKPLTDDAVNIAKPYVDDAINWAGRWINNNYSKEGVKKVENIIIKREKPGAIYGTDGSVLFNLNGKTYASINGKQYIVEQNLDALNKEFNKIHYNILSKTLNHIASYKVYPKEVSAVIKKSINEYPLINKETTSVAYDETTNELVITIGFHTRRYLLEKAISHSLVVSSGGYLALNSKLETEDEKVSLKIPVLTPITAKKPIGRFEEIWVQHNIHDPYTGKYGMRIHAKFSIDNEKGKDCEIAAYFYFSTGESLNDFNNSYNSQDGKVSVGEHFTPDFDETVYKDYILFMPYDELHLDKGHSDLKFHLSLFSSGGNEIRTSNPIYFYFNK